MTESKPLKAFFIALLSIAFLVLHAFPAFFLAKHGTFVQNSRTFGFVVTACSLLALFAVPMLCVRFLFRKNFSDFGFRLPENTKEALRLTMSIFLVPLPFMMFFGTRPEFQQYYILKESVNIFFIFSIAASALYYVAEEFLFRGFLLFGLLDSLREKSKWYSFFIVSTIFTFFHIGKPLPEVVFAFFISLALCHLSFKTKSFLPAALLHFLLAITLNLAVLLFS